jgi:hypothetical protein
MKFASSLCAIQFRDVFIASVLVLICANTAYSQVPSHYPVDAVLGYWPFAGSGADASGRGRNFRVEGPVIEAGGFGIDGLCYAFDGRDDWMTLDTSIAYGKLSMTFSFWAKSSSQEPMQVLGQNCTPECWGDLRIHLNTGQCGIRGLSFKSPSHFATVPFSTNDGKWHHYALVFGRESTAFAGIQFYVDGLRRVTDSTSCRHNWGGWGYDFVDKPLDIGLRPGTEPFYAGHYFGSLDELCVWGRALADDEVLRVYEGDLVTSVNAGVEPSSTKGLVIRPTPSSERVTVTFAGSLSGACLVDVLSFSGEIVERVVESRPLIEPVVIPIDVSKYPPGVYVVRLTNDNDVFNQRMVVVR